MRYQQFASHAYCGAAGSFSKMAPQQEKLSVCSVLRCPDLWLLNRALHCTLHCNHRSGHLKTEHTESPFLLRRHLGNWPCSKHEKRTAGSACETWTVAAADGVTLWPCKVRNKFLVNFETAPFICKHTVFYFEKWLLRAFLCLSY